MSVSPIEQARELIRQLEGAIKSIDASMTASTEGQIKINLDTLVVTDGVATATVIFAPPITQPPNGISLDGNVIYAGTPDNPSLDPADISVAPSFPNGQTSTRRGILTFTPVPGMGAQLYELGVSILDSTGQVISSDNCLATVTS